MTCRMGQTPTGSQHDLDRLTKSFDGSAFLWWRRPRRRRRMTSGNKRPTTLLIPLTQQSPLAQAPLILETVILKSSEGSTSAEICRVHGRL